ncbi:MAG: hypothetical protein QGF00_13465 [Planctomycetota bacterium]|jgi:hypothetical protein|nr:hypothetical protein [Planctomycetota bacterium]MDP7250607.1 hypothetical protein [Planctomycetota bacterium]
MRNRTLSSLILLFGALLSSEVAVFAEEKAKPAAEDSDKLLAEKESKRGPTFPGDDPAFLVLPRPAQRSRQALELLTPEVRQMNERALVFLARAQDADGSWSDTQFPSNTGVTALACLAFMAEGSRPRIGKYGKSIDLGLEFILKNVQTSGVIAGKGSNKYGPMYEHAYSMLALLYSFGDMPWRPQTRDVISRGIQAMLKSQRLDGGWRYQFSREGHSDMSVTANVLWVLRTAKKSGFTVSQEAIDRGIKFVEQCANPDGSFRYRYFGIHASPSLGGTGIIALCNHGRIDHPLIPTARDRIEYDYRRYTVNDLKERRYFVFGCFYASLATYMSGDAYWMPWFKKAVKVLATMQRKDGEIGDQHDNTIYSTAMASIVLQAPKGYLPIYER